MPLDSVTPTLQELSAQLERKEVSPVEILESYLDKIENNNSQINAFIEVETEQALNQARQSENRWSKGQQLSKLDGLPIGIKDNILRKGRKTTCASKMLEPYISPYDASVIEKLNAAGMVNIGRLNMDEFAMGSSTENSGAGITRNPHDLERAPGGSSGGSAAAVAAGMVPVSLGSDTGGSVRQPASFCGVVGLRPTYGTVSRYGLVAFASSLDVIGPMASTVEDAKSVYDIIKGYDERDSTSVKELYQQEPADCSQLKLGVCPALLDGCDKDVKLSYESTLNSLRPFVKDIIDVDLPHQHLANSVYYLIANSEASANLARFDGVRYGRRSGKVESLQELYINSRSEGFGLEVKRRILLGTFALSSGYYDAYYGKAQKVRSLIARDYQNLFTKVDALLLPTSPTVPFKLGEKTEDPVSMYLSDLFTVGSALAGIPAISVPSQFEKLPVGMQIQANYFQENIIFSLASQIESGVKRPGAHVN